MTLSHGGQDGGGSSQNKLRVDTSDPPSLLSPSSPGHEQEAPSPSRARSRAPSINLESPSGKTKVLHDGDLVSEGLPAAQADNSDEEGFYNHPNDSQGSFASIETVTDLGFTRQAKLGSPGELASASLSPTRNRHVGIDTDNSAQSRQSTGKQSAQVRLSDLLARSYHKSEARQDSQKFFLPVNEIERILSRDSVQEVLAEAIPGISGTEELERLVQQICDRDRPRRRVLALLLLGERVECIKCFIKCGVDDTDLPFVSSAAQNASDADSFQLEGHSIHSRKNAKKQFDCLDNWKRSEREWLLGTGQHTVTPPFFDLTPGKLLLYTLPHDTILPFTEYEQAGEGGYASVWKVSIHPAQHNLPKQEGVTTQYFAVKSLHTHRRDEYEREVMVLERFSGKNPGHPHLIRLLLTYQHKRNYHMIFPWADGNLRNLWEEVKLPKRDQVLTCWMLSQFHGIADGLREIHGSNDQLDPNERNRGRHGDIKPENILWIKDDMGKKDHLVISDFGLTRFHSPKSQSEEKVPGCSPSYRPPECALPRLKISLSYDIWTLGCLFLDFLTWYFLGWDGVETTFSDARLVDEGWTPGSPRINPTSENLDSKWLYEDKFFRQSSDGIHEMAELKPSVIKWMEMLHNRDDCPQFAHDILSIIHRGLLHPHKKKRWDCSKVVAELDRVRQKCKSSEEYCLAPHKWTQGSLEVFQVSYQISSIQSLNEQLQNLANSEQENGPPSLGSLSPSNTNTNTNADTDTNNHTARASGAL